MIPGKPSKRQPGTFARIERRETPQPKAPWVKQGPKPPPWKKKGKPANWLGAFKPKPAKVAPTLPYKRPGRADRGIRAVSVRQARLNRKYNVVAAEHKNDHPYCQICILLRRSPRPTEHTHHIIPRSVRPDLLCDRKNMLSACSFCHDWVDRNREIAYLWGILGKSHDNLDELKHRREQAELALTR